MSLSRKPDSEIIEDSFSSPNAFGEIFERHAKLIFRYVARRAPTGTDIASVVAEVFERAFRLRHRYDPSYRESIPWLKGIARNVLSETARSDYRRRTVVPPVEGTVNTEDDILDRVMSELSRTDIGDALALLSDPDRETLLAYANGLTYTEIARALDIPGGTVASRIARARRQIREAKPRLDPMSSEVAEEEVR